MRTRCLLVSAAVVAVALFAASVVTAQAETSSRFTWVGCMNLATQGLNETVPVEIPARLLFADEPARLAVLRLTLDGVTTNELTLLQLTQLQAGSAEPVDGGSGPLPLSVPVARDGLLVVSGSYALEVAAVTGDGSAETLLSREDIFGSAELSELQYRLRFADGVLREQVEAAEAALAVVEGANPALFAPDSSGIQPLSRGVLETHRRQLDSSRKALADWLSNDGTVMSPEGPVVEAGLIRKMVMERERIAYDVERRSPGAAVTEALLSYVGTNLDRVNTWLLQARMELEEYAAKPAPTDLEQRHMEKLTGRIADLEREQGLLLALYLRLEQERLKLPAFMGWPLDDAENAP